MDSQSQSAFAEAAPGRIGHNAEAESLDRVADTIQVEVHHKASRGSPGLEGNLEARTGDWGAEVHKDGSREGRANAEGIVEAVAGAVDFGFVAAPDLSMAGRTVAASLVVAFVRIPQLWGDEHSVGDPCQLLAPLFARHQSNNISASYKYQKEGNGNIHMVLRSRWFIENDLHPKCFIILR